MKILVLTTSGFAPTHTKKLLTQIDYLASFPDIEIIVEKDCPLADIEYIVMTQDFDCIFPTTVFEYSASRDMIVSFNKVLYQILEYHHQSYIGSELFVHMLLNDKALTNIRCGMSLPNLLLTKALWENRHFDAVQYIKTAPYPVIVKPNTLAASLGISKDVIAYSPKEALEIINAQFDHFPNVHELLLERYLHNAREFTVSVTGNDQKLLCSTTALVSRTQEYEMFSYTNKNLAAEKRSLWYTSDIPSQLQNILKEKAASLFRLLQVRDYSRFDFLMDEKGVFYLIDANSLPALGANYMLEYIDRGIVSQKQVLSLLLLVFCRRTGVPYPQCVEAFSDEILRYVI